MLKNVGKMPSSKSNLSQKMAPVTNLKDDDYCRGVQWPMCLTAGDISRDGKILIRNYECKFKFYCNFMSNSLEIRPGRV